MGTELKEPVVERGKPVTTEEVNIKKGAVGWNERDSCAKHLKRISAMGAEQLRVKSNGLNQG